MIRRRWIGLLASLAFIMLAVGQLIGFVDSIDRPVYPAQILAEWAAAAFGWVLLGVVAFLWGFTDSNHPRP